MAEKQKILIVDDDSSIAELVSLYLEKECYDTRICEDGEEALKSLEKEPVALIILDLMLPGIDGYEVCRRIRTSSNVPIIMLSAKGETFDKVLGLELGADDYMLKPFDTKELVARVKAVLRRSQHVFSPPLEEEKEKEKPEKNQGKVASIGRGKVLGISPEINLIGKMTADALPELNKYLDDAFLARLPQVRIVHGRGTGALRKMVQECLKKNKHIESFRLGEYGEGSDGVSIAFFKK